MKQNLIYNHLRSRFVLAKVGSWLERPGVYGFLLIPFLLGGCVNVEPWERENLAKNEMQLVPNALLNQFTTHVNWSREDTEGGYALEGGGCGCN